MKTLFIFLCVLTGLYLVICLLLYIFQEKLIFFPQNLDKDHKFRFSPGFEERFVEMEDGKKIHALLFRSEDPQAVVFYLHGNAGSLENWGEVAETFTRLDHDVFLPDYRGYGKSEGSINSEYQLNRDIQKLYEVLKNDYSEKQIIVLGHSIGSGMAAKIAAANSPKLLILQAPMYSLPDLVNNIPPFNVFPGFILRYKFRTGKYLKQTEAPVVVLHGDEDEIVYYGSSLKLQREFKPEDTLITLNGAGHNNFLGTGQYKREIKKILEKY